MKVPSHLGWLAIGIVFGAVASMFYLGPTRSVGAASSDRFQDYVMTTGAVTINPRVPMDGVWMLDYRSGKLLGTVIDKNAGKIVGWSEVDLVAEFGVNPRQDVHFMMVSGWVSQGQSALYVAETTTGKFGVYTMANDGTGTGVVIRRHDMTNFRKNAEQPVNAGANAGG